MISVAKPESINKILVIDLAFIGDVILATPVLRALRGSFPKARITMLTIPLTAEIAAMDPYVDNVLVYDKHGEHQGFWGMLRIAGLLRRHHFDLAVCMNFALRGALVAWLARIPERVGYDAQLASLFLTRTTSHERDGIKHEALNHLEVLRSLYLDTSDTSLAFRLPEAARQYLEQKVPGLPAKGYIAICPFGSYAKKNLTLDTAAQVAAHLAARMPVYLIGGKKEQAGLAQVAFAADLPAGNVLAGELTLQELAVFLQGAAALVTVDTGPLHMAQAVKCPVLAIFGPTDPVIWGPRGEADKVIYHHMACSPCWGKGTCTQNSCIADISAVEIMQAADALLEGADHE